MATSTEPSDRAKNPLNGKRLESWKGIANYLGRSLRTVRRWEHEENLPVHRHIHKKQGTVYALADEIESWLRERSDLVNQGTLRGASRADSGNGCGAVLNQKGQSMRPILIAVIPHCALDNSSFEKHLAEGLAEAILLKLGQLDPDQIRTVAYSTVMQYLQSGRSIAQLCRDLSLDYVLETGGRIQGVHARLVACLVDARDQIQLWAESFELEIPSTLSMEHQFADALLKSLPARLGLPLAERNPSLHPSSRRNG